MDSPINNNLLNIDKLDTLFFSGGGVRGFVYLGCCQVLYELNLLSKIKTFCGSSAGAMISFVITLGYKPMDILEILLELSFDNIPIFSNSILSSLTTNYGLSKQEKLLNILSVFLTKKGFSKGASFQEMYNKTGIHLIIIGSCLNTQDSFIMDYKNTPSMKVLEAIKISISFPLFFEACSYEGRTYIDGALSIEYPIKFLKNKLQTTLGFCLSNEFIYIPKIDSIETYILSIYNTLCKNYVKLYSSLYKNNTIIIPCSIDMLDFSLDKKKKNEMFYLGYIKTAEFMHKNKIQNSLCKELINWSGFCKKEKKSEKGEQDGDIRRGEGM